MASCLRRKVEKAAVVCSALLAFASFSSSLFAQVKSRDQMVRDDRQKVEAEGFWIYNDLERGFAEAKKSGKPMLVVLRCIPCKECVKLDDDLIDQDPIVRPLLDQFVCVRIVSTNGLDLSLFQYDTDQSFAVFMLNSDRTIYGRFGTRSHQTEWFGDVSLKGLAQALQGALDLHQQFPEVRKSLAAKQGSQPEFDAPEKFPALKDAYTSKLNYDGQLAKSCIHCHQIGDALRQYYWQGDNEIPEQVLFPFPHPKVVGAVLDPDQRSRVKEIVPDSAAANAGLKAGDEIVAFNGQPLLSIADFQWVLQQTDSNGAELPLTVNRDGKMVELKLALADGWRRAGDISWRASSWGYRRMVTGGLALEQLKPEARVKMDLPEGVMALRVKHAGEYGAHAAAKNAGARRDDVLISYDGKTDLDTESELLAYAITHHKIGDKVLLELLRDGKKVRVEIPIQE